MKKVMQLAVGMVLVFGIGGTLQAQFQVPTQAEREMKTDPKAPSASAVYLNYEETYACDTKIKHTHARIKILTEPGLSQARISLFFSDTSHSIQNLHAQTTHPDGKAIVMTAKPAIVPHGSQTSKEDGHQNDEPKAIHNGSVEFTFPEAIVGSILEYSYDSVYLPTKSNNQTWDVQKDLYVHHSRYLYLEHDPNAGVSERDSKAKFDELNRSFSGGSDLSNDIQVKDDTPGDPIELADILGAPETIKKPLLKARRTAREALFIAPILPPSMHIGQSKNDYFLYADDVPAIPQEEFMPIKSAFAYNVKMYWDPASGRQDISEFWSGAADMNGVIADSFLRNSSVAKDVVKAANATKGSEQERARKLYAFVQSFENVDFSKKPTNNTNFLRLSPGTGVDDILKARKGNSSEIALAYLALLKEAKIEAYAVIMIDRSKMEFDRRFMTVHQFNEIAIYARLNDEYFYLDPGAKLAPFGLLSAKHSACYAFQHQFHGKNSFITTPADSRVREITRRTADVVVKEDGSSTANVTLSFLGHEALRLRQMTIKNDADVVKKEIERTLQTLLPDGMKGRVDSIDALDNPEAELVAHITASGRLVKQNSSGIYYIPGQFFASQNTLPFVKTATRITPIDMHNTEETLDKVTYQLSAGVKLTAAPKGTNADWDKHAHFATTAESGENSVTITRQLKRSFIKANATDYQELHDFYSKAADVDKQVLTLSGVHLAADTANGQ